MDRREFVCSVVGGLLSVPLSVRAQKPARVAHIGVLSPYERSVEDENLASALEHFGYVDGKSAVIEWRLSAGRPKQLPELAIELVRLKVDVIIALGSEAARAAKQATDTIPIVFEAGNPVETELVQSLARPAGNLTGISIQTADLAEKYLQLLRDALPEAFEVGVIWSPNNPSTERFLRDAEKSAAQQRFKIQPFAIANPEDLNSALAAIARARTQSLIVLELPSISPTYDTRIVEFAIANRIATLGGARRMAERGLLMFYGSSDVEGNRQVASYVDKILKGVKPADLPIQQPTKFELVINLKTAKAIGIAVPNSLLLRADEVIQ